MAIVYQHIRKDNKDIFYIGIGTTESRAYEYGRNYLWQEVVDKTEYEVKITHENIIWEEACAIEKYLIAFWGRKDLGLGLLTNLTDGGDGSIGFIRSVESNKKQSESMKAISYKYKTKKFRDKMSEVTSGENNGMFGKNHKEDSICKMKLSWNHERKDYYREINLVEKNPMYGKKNEFRRAQNKLQTYGKNPRAIPVIQYDCEGNIIAEYSCIKEAHDKTGIAKIREKCLGYRKQTHGFIFKYKNNNKV